jgi:hypothetical protein
VWKTDPGSPLAGLDSSFEILTYQPPPGQGRGQDRHTTPASIALRHGLGLLFSVDSHEQASETGSPIARARVGLAQSLPWNARRVVQTQLAATLVGPASEQPSMIPLPVLLFGSSP